MRDEGWAMNPAARRMVVGVVSLVVFLFVSGRALAQERPAKLSVDLGGGVKMDFVLIQAGSFMMGAEQGEANERPVHQVKITKPFYMGAYEVTQAQWRAVMGENPLALKGDNMPAERVSWEDCEKFVAKLRGKVGQGMICRLPTEAEWEYACRAGSQAAYCFGDDEGGLGEYAWCSPGAEGSTHPVGQKKPNAWGLYDMHGNVWEWCADWYDEGYYAKSPVEDPKGPAEGELRVLRGGAWHVHPVIARSASRFRYDPVLRYLSTGCRVVVSAQD